MNYKVLLCIVGVVIACFFALSFMSGNDEISIPENAKILAYDYNGDDPGELVRYHYEWERREKVDEDDDYYYYKATGSDNEYNVIGDVSLILDREHVNASSPDLNVLISEFEKISHHEYNDTHFGNLYDRNSASASDGIDYAKNLNYSSFDGENAYISICDENGKLSVTKKLDEFFFACHGNGDQKLYQLEFDSLGADRMDIYRGLDDDRKVELTMIFNSDDEPYVLKIPLKAKHKDDYEISRNY